jgi:hypothetical protein
MDMAEKQTISIKMDITDDLRKLLKDLNEMDKESKTKLKERVKVIAGWVAEDIKTAASYAPMYKQAMRVAQTTRANKDRVPNITIGGSRVKFSGGAVSGDVLIGSEFGADPTSANGQFPNGGRRFPYRSPKRGQGNEGYWIYPELRRLQPKITREWHEACDDVLSNWKKGVDI